MMNATRTNNIKIRSFNALNRQVTSWRVEAGEFEATVYYQRGEWVSDGRGKRFINWRMDGSTLILRAASTDEADAVDGRVIFPERGDFSFNGTVQELGRLTEKMVNLMGLCNDPRFTFRRE